jgi:peptide-methionine (S)-S-oxide reductase
MFQKGYLYLFTCFFLGSCSAQVKQKDSIKIEESKSDVKMENRKEAIFGAGCFWCTEAFYTSLDGVVSVTPGYAGGTTKNPTYEEVCTGSTGHAEVAKIVYDSTKISFEELLEVFWFVHDPTSLNRQGNDVGTQYRSVIFYMDDNQRELAEIYKRKLNESGAYERPVVTEIKPLTVFYPAEDYHNNYFANNPNQPYCSAVIRPKVEKFRKAFHDKLKN